MNIENKGFFPSGLFCAEDSCNEAGSLSCEYVLSLLLFLFLWRLDVFKWDNTAAVVEEVQIGVCSGASVKKKKLKACRGTYHYPLN